MTSPDERFDDAFLPRQYEVYDPERHEYRIGIGVWPAVCYHCGFPGGAQFGFHVCGMAIADWVWQMPKSRDAGTIERAYKWAAWIQTVSEAEVVSQSVVPRSEAEFWNRMF